MNVPVFRGYEIIEVLPRGGMSTVYKARQLSLDRIVAIKALPPAMGVEKADVEKFMAEARITAGLKHTNIVQVYDFGKSEDGIYYFAMEYISGYSIAAWIRRKKILSEENSLLCALSIAAAMNYAWQKAKIVHCDIKPDNVIIDGDGTVKVADLGLARSVKSILGQVKSEEGLVVGTPNYISPEQARGDEALDCRADIYSLGAMLYHCLTGGMPFENAPPLEVMDRHVTDQIPDPQDVNPRISVWSSCLIEKMMAKDRGYRQKDWQETIRDLSNARSEKMPQGILPENVVSTVKRSPLRSERLKEIFQPAGKKPAKTDSIFRYIGKLPKLKKTIPPRLWPKVILAAAAGALVITVAWNLIRPAQDKIGAAAALQRDATEEHVLPAGSPESKSARSAAEARAQENYEQALAWSRANPGNLKEAIARLRKAADEAGGTRFVELARKEALRLERVQKEAGAVLARLDKDADALARKNRFREAANLYEKYRGPFERETSAERRRKEQVFQGKHNDFIEKQRRLDKLAAWQLENAADEIATAIVDESPRAALEALKTGAAVMPLIASKPEFTAMETMLEKSAGAEGQILDSFRAQKGRGIEIMFLAGTQKLVVRDVRGDHIIADKVTILEQGTISTLKTFRVRDLALSEKINRVGKGNEQETALMDTVLALQDANYHEAGLMAAKTGALLSGALGQAISQRSREIAEWNAAQTIANILRNAGIYRGGKLPDPQACLESLREEKPAARRGAKLKKDISQFREKLGSTETAKRYEGVLDALARGDTALRDAQTQGWPLPKTEERIKPDNPPMEYIVRKLAEQNPGLRGEEVVFRMDDSGQITSLEIVSINLKEIKPIENLVNLQKLVCAGMRRDVWSAEMQVIAPLLDLTPLRRMNLRELVVNHARVKEISILSQMPLEVLNLANTRVSDLHPLKKMPLRWLNLNSTAVQDIRPLAGLPLVRLSMNNTEVSDLNPLRDMQIEELEAFSTKVKDLYPLRSMPLKRLNVHNTEISEIYSLKGLPLECLDIGGTGVRDISALRDMTTLRKLVLSDAKVLDLRPLAQLPLEGLWINGCRIRDLSPLKNMPLKELDLSATDVIDLTPLEQLPLEEIWLDDFYSQANSEKTRALMNSLQKMPKLRMVNNRAFGAVAKRDEQ